MIKKWSMFIILVISRSFGQSALISIPSKYTSWKNYKNSSNSFNISNYTEIDGISVVNKTKSKFFSIIILALSQLCILSPPSCKDMFQKLIHTSLPIYNEYDFIEVYNDGRLDYNITWADVVGVENAIIEMQRLLNIVSSDEIMDKARRSGVSAPRNILLVGPPGTGKTLLARAAANSLGAPLLVVSASEIVKGKYVGVGVERVKNLFVLARQYAKMSPQKMALIFIDELDSCGRERGGDTSAAGSDRDNTLNQLLVELDGFNTRENNQPLLIVIGATNRRDILDTALLRKGRFDNIVCLDYPNLRERIQLFNLYIRKQINIAKTPEILLESEKGNILCRIHDKKTLTNSSIKIITPVRAPGIKIPITLFSNHTARLLVSDINTLLGKSIFTNFCKKQNGGQNISYKTVYNESSLSNEFDFSLIDHLASLSSGLVGADIASIVNEAAISAMEQDRILAMYEDYMNALENAILGKPVFKDGSNYAPPPDWRVAIHEAGHILASFILEHVDNATRASIRPRTGGSLGVTMFGVGDVKNLRASELRDRLVMMLAGKSAEDYVFSGDSSTGAADDVNRALSLAQAIITTFAMNGVVHTTGGEASDDAIRSELLKAEKRANTLVREHEKLLNAFALRLMQNETLDGDALIKVFVDTNSYYRRNTKINKSKIMKLWQALALVILIVINK